MRVNVVHMHCYLETDDTTKKNIHHPRSRYDGENILRNILTLNSVTVLYSLFLILSFMVLKSIGCLMIIE